MSELSSAGDGTPVVTSAYPRSKSTCDCRAQGIADCNHHRLYMISTTDSPYDLPLYPRLQPASRHDAVSLVMGAVEFKQRFTLGTVDKMLLDATHGTESTYLLLAHQGIEPFIDLNVRAKNTVSKENPEIQISPFALFPANAEISKPQCSFAKIPSYFS